MTPGEHRAAAATAHAAATSLYESGSAWHVVPCHYAALHLIHADLLERPGVPPEMQSPERHRSHWRDSQRISWGLNDVVREIYPDAVSRQYTALAAGSHAVRYSAPFKAGDRFWNHYLEVRRQFER